MLAPGPAAAGAAAPARHAATTTLVAPPLARTTTATTTRQRRRLASPAPRRHVAAAAAPRRPRLPNLATNALPPGGLDAVAPALLRAALDQAHPGLAAGALANTLVFVAGARVLLAGLTFAGVLHSWALGALSWAAFGKNGYALVCLYFLAGSAVTRLGLARKQAEGTAEARGGRRGPGSVWGSGAAGAACAALALLLALGDPAPPPLAAQLQLLPPRLAALASDPAFWRVGFVASFASKLADTASSEVGKAYGRTTYLATTFQRVPRGTEGAVSAEGTGAGVVAALAFASAALSVGQLASWGEAGAVVAAAALANAFESVLGASAQGRAGAAWLTNDAVNVLQICVAAAVALALRAALLAV